MAAMMRERETDVALKPLDVVRFGGEVERTAGPIADERRSDAYALSSTDPGGNAESVALKLGATYLTELSALDVSGEFVRLVPIDYARRHGIIALRDERGDLFVALSALDSWDQVDVVGRLLGEPARALFASPHEVRARLNLAYQQQDGQAAQLIDRIDGDSVSSELIELSRREDLLSSEGRAPVIRLVNLLLFEAARDGASDVHIQPYEDRLVVRLRIDGMLFNAFTLPKAIQEEVVSRIKVMGRMNIAEKRLAQDGRATVSVGDRLIDLRLSAVPASFGERVVIRLLDKSARLYSLEELGMDPQTLSKFARLISVEHGLLLVTGPTGSGKTTTLYAALQRIDAELRNIITLEDPIEYQLEGISQIQVSTKKGMTFASGLRSVLRQDPDIIMVGEVRDHETAVLAIQAALTGHLVFSTLHTNDAASAISRLLDLGVEPYLAASSLIGVLAQRLVRRVCAACGSEVADPRCELALLDAADTASDEVRMLRGVGCNACRGSGYRGRIGLFELLDVDEAIRALIHERTPSGVIKRTASDQGMRTLRMDGLSKVLDGRTTAEEVARVTLRASE